MISQALLYVPTREDARAALLPVAGRPVAFRVVVAAVRAGIRRVGVPGLFLGTAVEAAITSSPAARAAVVWLSGDDDAWRGPTVLLPATVLVPAPDVARFAAAAPGTAGAGGLARGDLPLGTVDAPRLAPLWRALARGEPVGGALGELLGSMPRISGGSYARVDSVESARRAEAGLYAALGSPIDTWIDRRVHRRLSWRVSALAVRWGVTPNRLSVASLLAGLAAAGCVWQATPPFVLAGLALYVGAVVLDHADGEVARLTLTESRFGHWLDLFVDAAVLSLLGLSMGLATVRLGHPSGLPLGLLAAVGVVASALTAGLLPIERSAGAADRRLTRILAALGNRDGYYATFGAFALCAGAAPRWLPWVMLVVAAGTNVYWITRLAATLPRRLRPALSGQRP